MFEKRPSKALGIREIEETIGLGRFAIRTEFSDEEGLFIKALKDYRERGIADSRGKGADRWPLAF